MSSLRIAIPCPPEPGDLGLDVVHRKAHMVEAHLLEPLDIRIGQRLRMPIAEELHFEPGHDVAQNERHMVRLDARNAHVSVH